MNRSEQKKKRAEKRRAKKMNRNRTLALGAVVVPRAMAEAWGEASVKNAGEQAGRRDMTNQPVTTWTLAGGRAKAVVHKGREIIRCLDSTPDDVANFITSENTDRVYFVMLSRKTFMNDNLWVIVDPASEADVYVSSDRLAWRAATEGEDYEGVMAMDMFSLGDPHAHDGQHRHQQPGSPQDCRE